MKTVTFPYGKGTISAELPENRLQGIPTSQLHSYIPEQGENELVAEALRHPIGTPSLRDMVCGKKNIVLIASDHTRPVPSRIIIPPMLEEIRQGSPDADITILIATGCHRGTTKAELVQKFGEEIVERENIVIHDCDDTDNLVSLGKLPSGGELKINRLAAEADFLCAEGFIEPHFFAGFSGGRKSVLPGIAARKTVMATTVRLLLRIRMPEPAFWRATRFIPICCMPREPLAWTSLSMLLSTPKRRLFMPSPATVIWRIKPDGSF